jgi:transcriptional regulator with XRE-family HTH domain
MLFKDLLQKLRSEAGLTQAGLADRARIPLPSLQGYEQGTRLPSWPVAVYLADALGVALDRLSKCDEITERGVAREVPPPARRRPPSTVHRPRPK